MAKNILFFVLFCFACGSCTKSKTDYEAEKQRTDAHEVIAQPAAELLSGNYSLIINTPNGKFYTGYNAVQMQLFRDNSSLEMDSVQVLCYFTDESGHKIAVPSGGAFASSLDKNSRSEERYLVFPNQEKVLTNYTICIIVYTQQAKILFQKKIHTESTPYRQLKSTTFQGQDGVHYCIALIAPELPQAGLNTIRAGIYALRESQLSVDVFPVKTDLQYVFVPNLVLKIDPRMPEPSMGNHSSPNNKDLYSQENDFYSGQVNFTMTGDWTLNFILQDKEEKVIKGNAVSTRFTPGVAGEKSDLYLDVTL